MQQLLKLNHQLTFYTVNGLLKDLQAMMLGNSATAVVLDLQSVTACDSAGLALLIELKRWCAKQKKTLQLVSMPHSIKMLARFCGVDDLLQG